MYNWENVFQSVTDVWLPTFEVVAVVAIVLVVWTFIKKKKNKND